MATTSTVAPAAQGSNAELARRLAPQHTADLRASGLTDETILANGFFTERDPATIAAILNWDRPARNLGWCLCIPFAGADGEPLPVLDRVTGEVVRNASGNPIPHVRVKPDTPRKDKHAANEKQKVYKYESRRGARNHVYVPVGAWALLADPTTPVLVTEGEKKAAAAVQAGHACIALVGVDGWSLPRPKAANGTAPARRELIPSLADALRGRPVVVMFDSDAATNPNVRRAEWQLAVALTEAGATVRIARLPGEAEGGKNGIDDYLIRYGAEAFAAIIAAAAVPTNPKTGRPLVTLRASSGTLIGEGCDTQTGVTPLPLRFPTTRERMHCTRGGSRDLLGCVMRTDRKGGPRGVECGVISTCAACLNNAQADWLEFILPAVVGEERPIAIWRGPRSQWCSLLAHLRRLRRRHGCDRYGLVTVRRNPTTGETFALFAGAPPSDRLTVVDREAALELAAEFEAVELCPNAPKKWYPVRYSADMWLETEEEREAQWAVVNCTRAMELSAKRRVFRRYGCTLQNDAGRFIVLATGNVRDAYDEMTRLPAWLRNFPTERLGRCLSGFWVNELWEYWNTGDLPRDLPPLPTGDRVELCDRIDAIVPGRGRTVWERGYDTETLRELLRGLLYWRTLHPDVEVAAVPAPAEAEAAEIDTQPQPDLPMPPADDAPEIDLESNPEFAALADEVRRLAEYAGGAWPVYVQRAVDAGDAAGLLSYRAALRRDKPAGREAG